MATKPITDGKPTSWTLKGGRHNALSRHIGEHGLWYLIGTWGSGRYMDEWSLMVFPESVKIGGYAGEMYSVIVNPTLASNCLLSLRGKGGHDFGKGFSSKGGYRAGGAIPYMFKKQPFDPTLLKDGDEFLRQVLGYEPTVKGIQEGLERDRLLAEKRKVEAEERQKAFFEDWEAKREENRRKVEGQKAVFGELKPAPEFWFQSLGEDGLHVWQDFQGGKWGEKILATPAEYQIWYEAKMEENRKTAEENEKFRAEQAKAKVAEEANKTNIASQKLSMAERLRALKK